VCRILLSHAASRIRREMKKELNFEELSDDETATSTNDDPQQDDARQGRSGEGAHSAMKHWLNEERNRLKRPEH
jgi:hypothetical protein